MHVAFGIDWKPGDRIVLFEGEFPANVTPWQQAAATFGLEVVMLPSDDLRNSALPLLERELQYGVRLVATSAVRFQTGLRMPLAEMGRLCADSGAEFFVDAIQGLGAVPLDLNAAHYIACGGHKWLMAPSGTGFVAIRQECVDAMVPRLAGWTSHEEAFGFLVRGAGHLRHDRPIRKRANYVEQGSVNLLGIAGLEASLGLIQQLGIARIYDHIQRYHDALEPSLVELGFITERPGVAARSGILSVLPPPGVELSILAERLAEHGVAVSTPDGRLRFAPHWPNALSEVPHVVHACRTSIGR